jgi:hypothetical protein
MDSTNDHIDECLTLNRNLPKSITKI